MKVVKRNDFWFPSIFDGFLTENKFDAPNYEKFSKPAVNISENFTNFVIDLAVPGLRKKNFAIEIEKNVLKVSSNFAPKRDSIDTEKELPQFIRQEFNYGSFTRTFTLPETVNVEDVEAEYTDGVLSISLPKKEVKEDLKRMIEIS